MSEPTPTTPWRTWWPHLRALLVAVHVFAITVQALPAPGGGMKRSAWQDPTVQGEFAAWTERLNGWGVAITQDELEDRLWSFAIDYMRLRGAVLDPFMPYYRHLGTWQSWRMFVAPHRYPARLHIEIMREPETWETIYVSRSREHDWRAEQFDHDRMRAATFRYSWNPYKTTYRQFVEWLAGEVAADFPDASHVRIRYHKYRTASPEEVRTGTEPEGRFQQERVRELGRYR